MIVDLGTGDVRAVLARAGCEPSALVIGVDALAPSMAESSRRADRRGPRNALFLAAGVEELPSSPLAGTGDLVTIVFPWGSLLRGALGVDQAALRGIASVVAPSGRLEVLASVVPGDVVADVEELDRRQQPAIADAWYEAGLQLTSMRPATLAEVNGSGSTWARRLGVGRPAWRLDGVRSG